MNDWDAVSNDKPTNDWDAVSTPQRVTPPIKNTSFEASETAAEEPASAEPAVSSDLAAAMERRRRRQQGQPIEEEEPQFIAPVVPESDNLVTGELLEQAAPVLDTAVSKRAFQQQEEELEDEVIEAPRRVQEPRAARPSARRKGISGATVAIIVLSIAVSGLSVLTGLNIFDAVRLANLHVAASANRRPISVTVNSDRTAIVQAEATNSVLSSEATVAAQPGGTYSGTTGCPTARSNFYIANVKTGMVMDDSGGSKNSGSGIIQYPFGGNSINQQWQFVAAGAQGNFKIINVLSGLVLDEPGGSQVSGLGIVQYTDDGAGGINQQWQCVFISNNQFKIVSTNSGLVLDVANVPLSQISNLQQDTYNGGLNQQWLFISI